MWDWSKTFAERALAAVWTRPAGEPRPTVVDPEPWREEIDRGSDRDNDDAMLVPAHVAEYCLIG